MESGNKPINGNFEGFGGISVLLLANLGLGLKPVEKKGQSQIVELVIKTINCWQLRLFVLFHLHFS